jgi:hypothetical protein
MRTVHARLLAVAVASGLILGNTVTAQELRPKLLNRVEVQQLVARGELADQARLSAHFAALAEGYATEAKRHLAMSQSFVGNPSRNFGLPMSAHCTRLATLNTESATTARELAAYHDKLASGKPATAPTASAPYQAGAGAPKPNEQELNALAAKAATAAEHRVLGEYFAALAKKYTADADEHVAVAKAYRGTRLAQAAVHHDRLARMARDAAKEANEAAAMHKNLAAPVR